MLETNFKAIVAELKARPSSPRQSAELEALLSKLDSDVRHSMLRAQAANFPSHQRMQDRTSILQKSFTRVVELLHEPASTPPASPSGAACSPSLSSSCRGSACMTGSPLTANWHPWSGSEYSYTGSRPAGSESPANSQLRSPAHTTPTPPGAAPSALTGQPTPESSNGGGGSAQRRAARPRAAAATAWLAPL